jgi:hypothetical protein
MNMADLVALIDANAAEIPVVPGPYKKKVDEISTETSPPIRSIMHRGIPGFCSGLTPRIAPLMRPFLHRVIHRFSTTYPPGSATPKRALARRASGSLGIEGLPATCCYVIVSTTRDGLLGSWCVQRPRCR